MTTAGEDMRNEDPLLMLVGILTDAYTMGIKRMVSQKLML